MVPWHTRDPRSQPEEDLADARQLHRQGGGKIQHCSDEQSMPSSTAGRWKYQPSTEEPDEQRTKLYQELVGSLAYISTYTQPDVAQTHSESSRYLQNPGQKHISAAYHVWKYLIGQKRLAIGTHGDQSSRTIYTGSSLGGA
jgi:hypothetical protein